MELVLQALTTLVPRGSIEKMLQMDFRIASSEL